MAKKRDEEREIRAGAFHEDDQDLPHGILPTDAAAAADADTSRSPQNLEESKTTASRRLAIFGGPRCPTCRLPALADPKELHKCSRCRSELLPAVAQRRTAERADAKAREEAARNALMGLR